ncbi:MAG: hypothetical protein QOD33_632 [Pyrinomonadaceae bacterium]|jgi:hypothetical protein|nr:hypothetical protein [Pyrinomonadaceae bacterium]
MKVAAKKFSVSYSWFLIHRGASGAVGDSTSKFRGPLSFSVHLNLSAS